MKINLKSDFKDLNDKAVLDPSNEVENLNMGKWFGAHLYNSTGVTGMPTVAVKVFAQDIYKTGEGELSDAERESMKAFIETMQAPVWLKSQLIECLK